MGLITYLELYLKDKAEVESDIRISANSGLTITIWKDVEEKRSRQLLVDIATMIYAYEGSINTMKISTKRIGNTCVITIKTK